MLSRMHNLLRRPLPTPIVRVLRQNIRRRIAIVQRERRTSYLQPQRFSSAKHYSSRLQRELPALNQVRKIAGRTKQPRGASNSDAEEFSVTRCRNTNQLRSEIGVCGGCRSLERHARLSEDMRFVGN